MYEDSTFISLPIPEPARDATPDAAVVRYSDIDIGGSSLGPIVEGLTRGAVVASTPAHLDPDLRAGARPRPLGWRPAFGQAGAAQAHLENQGVAPGDLFVYFGWFRDAEHARGTHRFRPGAADVHALFGWLQVDVVLSAGPHAALPSWAAAHPHATTPREAPNALYVARDTLTIDGIGTGLPGAGVFERLHDDLVLTAQAAGGRPGPRSHWRLPKCFVPEEGAPRMTYHANATRWAADPESKEHVLLRTAVRGQEFVVDTSVCPGVVAWAVNLIARHGASSPEALDR